MKPLFSFQVSFELEERVVESMGEKIGRRAGSGITVDFW